MDVSGAKVGVVMVTMCMIVVRRNAMMAIAIVIGYYVVYRIIFSVGMAFISFGLTAVEAGSKFWQTVSSTSILTGFLYYFMWLVSVFGGNMLYVFWETPLFMYEIHLFSIFFWAGFAPSI
jgi:hypothetical protein